MNLLADTDFLIEIYRNNQDAMNKLESLAQTDSQISTTTINAAEMYLGAFKSINTTNSLYRVNQLLSGFDVIDFSVEHALTYGELVARLKGKEIGSIDSMIASVALAQGKIVLTRNIKHFDKTGVMIETW
ncbi:MAG: type II toxin-antitoxin system VapC family toxin [Candidatus Kariarchaeaceae archaeon]